MSIDQALKGKVLGRQAIKEGPSAPTRGSFDQLKQHFGDCFDKVSHLGYQFLCQPL